PTAALYTLSLHDALPIWALGVSPEETGRGGEDLGERRRIGGRRHRQLAGARVPGRRGERLPREGGALGGHRPTRPGAGGARSPLDRKSTRLNSSHLVISY